jgi:hypothetical protein
VPALRVSRRMLIHPLTAPEFTDSTLTTTHSYYDQLLVVDEFVGALPLVVTEQHLARAVAEDWVARIRASSPDRPFNPLDRDTVRAWATQIANNHPRARLITEIQWPRDLPTTPYH